jgi:hypothetical protein
VLTLEYGRANKCIGIAGWVPAGQSSAVPGPEEFAAFLALHTQESLIYEEVQSIFVLGEHVNQLLPKEWRGLLKGFPKEQKVEKMGANGRPVSGHPFSANI